jgi:hypothetical protein
MCPLKVGMQKKEATGSTTPPSHHSEKHMGFLNSWALYWVLPADETVKFNGLLRQFLVDRAFRII